jgi:hypothetical protein
MNPKFHIFVAVEVMAVTAHQAEARPAAGGCLADRGRQGSNGAGDRLALTRRVTDLGTKICI